MADEFWLRRYTVRPRHLDAYLPLWREELAHHRRLGADPWRCFVETDAEPRMTWLYSTPEDAGSAFHQALADDAAAGATAGLARPHLFRNQTLRAVEPQLLTRAEAASLTGSQVSERIAIMRRYEICNGWDDFLAIWRQIVPVRERYGFRCLFAVADRPKDLFTWAFDFDGRWEDFPAAQHDYYHDPARVELRKVFDHMADYSLHPARQLLL